MTYIDPSIVDSPRKKWRLIKVLYNAKSSGWSVAQGEWEGDPAIGIRWNGSDEDGGVGNPQSRGNPTWFIVPDAFKQAVLSVVEDLKHADLQPRVFHPEGYDPSVWRLEISISEKTQEELSRHGPVIVHFSIPEIKDANIIPEVVYRDYSPRENRMVAKFSKDGKWVGDIYMNPDKYSEAFLTEIKGVILDTIRKAIAGYMA